MPPIKSDARLRLSLVALLVAPAALALACGDTIHNRYNITNHYGDGGADGAEGGAAGEAGASSSPGGEGGEVNAPVGGGGAGGDAGGDASTGDPRYPDAPTVTTSVDELPLELWEPGNHYWFAVSDDQLKQMNEEGPGGGGDGIYRPGGGGKAKWVDHLFITTAGKRPQTADYGKVQARIVGNYSRFPWDANNIPNLNIDSDQFVEGQRIAGYEHLRFSNGQRGSIFRDRVAYDLYRMLDYPAPLVTYAWVGGNVWGPGIEIPYILVERYKRVFCRRYEEEFGGGCPNMWEYYGDFNQGDGGGPKAGKGASLFDDPENCQIGECDATRAKELEARLAEAPKGEGFKAALEEYVDWPAFHRFQCLSWVLSTSDDPIHASNNVVLVERGDGKFQFLPYSVDISLGFGGGGWSVGLPGEGNALARGCQAEESCWQDTLDVCEQVITQLQELDPHAYLEGIWKELDDHGMLRPGDDGNYQGIYDYFTERLENLPKELEDYRTGEFCVYPQVDCHGTCVEYWECQEPCVPPKPEPVPLLGESGGVAGGDAPIGGGGPIECPMIVSYGVDR